MLSPWDEAASGKLKRVLGAEAGERMRQKVMEKMGLTSLKSANELFAFAELLGQEGGFAGALGGLLGVHATLRGATGQSARPPTPPLLTAVTPEAARDATVHEGRPEPGEEPSRRGRTSP